jgi:hypothetical protein
MSPLYHSRGLESVHDKKRASPRLVVVVVVLSVPVSALFRVTNGCPGNPLIVWNRVNVKENRVGLVDHLSAFACGPSETAGPSPTLPRISCPSLVALANFVRLSLMKAAYVALRFRDVGNPGPLQSG